MKTALLLMRSRGGADEKVMRPERRSARKKLRWKKAKIEESEVGERKVRWQRVRLKEVGTEEG